MSLLMEKILSSWGSGVTFAPGLSQTTGEQALLGSGGLSDNEVDPLEVDEDDDMIDAGDDGDFEQLMVMAFITAWPNSCRWRALDTASVHSGRTRKLPVGINMDCVEVDWWSCVDAAGVVVTGGGGGGTSFLAECFS